MSTELVGTMTGTDGSRSALEAAAGAAGTNATEAFKLLSDETRLAILLALWEAYDPRKPDPEPVSFTELYERVDAADSGNFAYHLGRLEGHFVEEDGDGYTLSNAGMTLVRAVIAGTGLDQPTLEPTEIPRRCPWCDEPVEISYEDQRLLQVCTACEGGIGPASLLQVPEGTLVVHETFDAAGLADRTPEEVFVAGTIDYLSACTLVIRGVCPECSGRIEASLAICEDHVSDPKTLCPGCGARDRARARYVCSTCKFNVAYPAWVSVFDHPAVVSFYYDHGHTDTFGLEDPEACGELWSRQACDQTLVSRDPVQVEVQVTCEGRTLVLTLDGDLDVIEIARHDHARTRPQPRT